MNPSTKVMLLVDADNVSVGVIEQAVERLLAEHGALHVRRAYCTAESARKNQALFKRLGMRPMVNLAAGKNSTDIALAVDAIDLVVAERPAVVVIASSDSDFAPLVSRLREKGCRVCGIGQEGKTGAETLAVYDEFVELGARPGRKGAAKAVAAAAAAPVTKSAGRRARPAAAKRAAPPVEVGEAAATAPRAEPAPPAARARKTVARKTPARTPAAKAPAAPVPPPEVQQLLQTLPALAQGGTLELQKAAEALRRGGQLSRRSSAAKLFARHPQWFELHPADDPRQVRGRKPTPT